MQTWTILLAAGRSSRLGSEKGKKQFLLWHGLPLFWHSVRIFAAIPAVEGIVLVLPSGEGEEYANWADGIARRENPGLAYAFAQGGQRRQDSVLAGLRALPAECSHVLIHDAARPFLSPDLVLRVMDRLATGAPGVIPGVAVTDTIKRVRGDVVDSTPPREELYAVQTPQGFRRETLVSAHEQALSRDLASTDDASLLECLGEEVILVQGEEKNKKITTPEDMAAMEEQQSRRARICTGWGYDVHRYARGRGLKLGGVAIPDAPAVEAHSDGDVALHAIMDAIFGCLGRGDIGDHFPDSDPAYRDINSSALLSETLALARKDQLRLCHLDLTIICQTPKMQPWKEQIRKNLCNLTGLAPEQVNVKATTEEGLGFTGQGKGIKAVAQITGLAAA
ncbi:MAG: 2-C-methyl-D-erythritol 4-phosphate cytidylyltransferase [Desulfohalobiaceae bacterium]|nr:2-C-methyl-D-erythritol 4-phosphate cytidylyltransferase [Desulfohalobiaceae bacterium]